MKISLPSASSLKIDPRNTPVGCEIVVYNVYYDFCTNFIPLKYPVRILIQILLAGVIQTRLVEDSHWISGL